VKRRTIWIARKKKKMINGGSRWGGKEPELVSREISVRAARNKRLSVDDSDFERTIAKGALTGGKRGKKGGRAGVGVCSSVQRERHQEPISKWRGTIFHTYSSITLMSSQAAQCRKNSARDKTEEPSSNP